MITLYHGTNIEFDKIDLSFSKVGKDFGCGFYLNPNQKQAFEMAERITDSRKYGTPIVNAYTFDESILSHPKDINIKVFDNYSEEWAEFVLMKRLICLKELHYETRYRYSNMVSLHTAYTDVDEKI